VDLQSAHTLAAMAGELTALGADVRVIEARSEVRERLRGEGLERQLGEINRLLTLDDVLEFPKYKNLAPPS
jgi:hypothetical protein